MAAIDIEVMISYDIEDNKVRTKLFDKLKDFGLRPIQRSVFWGTVIRAELKELRSLIEESIQEEDRVLILATNSNNQKEFIALNYAENFFKLETFDAI
jgi:CRISPR-associated protein Cas2